MTTNKALYTPANGADVGFWDQPVNGNMTVIDAALGTSAALTQTGAGAYPLTGVVSGSGFTQILQYQCGLFNVSGVLTGNVTYQIPAGVGGVWHVNTTGLVLNNFTCTFASLTGGGNSVDVQANVVMAVTCDGTNVRPLRPAGNYNGVILNPNNITLTPSQAGALIYNTVANTTLNLPGPAAVPGRIYSIWSPAGNTFVNTPSGHFYGPSGNNGASITLAGGNAQSAVVNFASDGSDWVVTSSTSATGSSSQYFVASGFAANEGVPSNLTTGYTFLQDGGYDTGMFSTGDGIIDFFANNVNTAVVTSGLWTMSVPVTFNGAATFNNTLTAVNGGTIGGATIGFCNINNCSLNGACSVVDGTSGQNPMSYAQLTGYTTIGSSILIEFYNQTFNRGQLYPGSVFGGPGTWIALGSLALGNNYTGELFTRVN